MKLFGFIIAFTLLFFSSQTYAQERSGLGNEENFKGQDELNTRADSRINNGSSSVSTPVSVKEKDNHRDSVAIAPVNNVRNKPDASTQKKPEDETLSFNLLYFIFQKFKVSEMLD